MIVVNYWLITRTQLYKRVMMALYRSPEYMVHISIMHLQKQESWPKRKSFVAKEESGC